MNNIKKLTNVLLKTVAVGMAGAVVVLSTLTTLAPETGVDLLALGMLSLALAVLQQDA